MYILGLNLYHPDAAACLVRDGTVVAAVAEERLGQRIKHFAGFPAEAIRAVLEMEGITIADVEHVAVGHNARANLGAKLRYGARTALRRPDRMLNSAARYLGRVRHVRNLQNEIAERCGFDPKDCRFRVTPVEHHQAHIASSYFSSGFEEAAAMSYDASGDFVSTMYAHCKGQELDVLGRVHLPHSLGYLYTAICQFIGFDHYGEEYKVMGLAAYGTPRYLPLMERMATYKGAGQFRLDPKFFNPLVTHMQSDEQGQMMLPPLYTEALLAELGAPRPRAAPIGQREMDLAASVQLHFENLVIESLRWLHDQVPVDALVTAGGAALNGVCNARILRETPFRRSYIHCAAGDDGTAIGVALYVWNVLVGGERSPEMVHAYLGPEHDDAEIAAAIDEVGADAERLSTDEVIERAAELLSQGKVIGWYQGRSEWGPRALGNRSILAHPGWPAMKDIINQKVKRREQFRPFAPTILADRAAEYFEQDVHSPFMMHVVRIREEKRSELAAVTHEDFTGRLHTVSPDQNPLYYRLISRFAELTGTPVVLNTSFNENEPIVQTPKQALGCYMRNDIDALFLGDRLLVKEAAQAAGAAGQARSIA